MPARRGRPEGEKRTSQGRVEMYLQGTHAEDINMDTDTDAQAPRYAGAEEDIVIDSCIHPRALLPQPGTREKMLRENSALCTVAELTLLPSGRRGNGVFMFQGDTRGIVRRSTHVKFEGCGRALGEVVAR
jgi:hypothetical protein